MSTLAGQWLINTFIYTGLAAGDIGVSGMTGAA